MGRAEDTGGKPRRDHFRINGKDAAPDFGALDPERYLRRDFSGGIHLVQSLTG
jgi:hypothetical protein